MSLEMFRQSPEEFAKFVEGAEKAGLSPNGWYGSVPPLTKKVSEDGNSIRIFGPAKLTTVDEKFLAEYPESAMEIGGQVFMGFNLSFKDPSEFGARLTAAAYRAYTHAYGKHPGSVDELVDYLATYPISLRAVQGKANDEKGFPASMMVVDIRAPRE